MATSTPPLMTQGQTLEGLSMAAVDFVIENLAHRLFIEAGKELGEDYSVERCVEWAMKHDPPYCSEEFSSDDEWKAVLEKRWESGYLRLRQAVKDLLLGHEAKPVGYPENKLAFRAMYVHFLLNEPNTDCVEPRVSEFQDLSHHSVPHDFVHPAVQDIVELDEAGWDALWTRAYRKVYRVITGKSLENQTLRFPARWYGKATAQALYAGLLRMALRRGLIKGKKHGGKNHYDLESVCSAYPQYEVGLKAYLNRNQP